jgi:hypothetical protein
MLILTRKVGETIMIGPDVTVTVLGVKGNQVRIGSTRRRTSPCTGKKSTSASSASNRKCQRHRSRVHAGRGRLVVDLSEIGRLLMVGQPFHSRLNCADT